MVKFTDAQRAVLVQAFPAVAHLGLGAMVFGQFLREQSFSFRMALAGIGMWLWFVSMAVVVAGAKAMTNVILMFVGIALVGTVVVFLDWLARRKEQQSERQPPA